MMPLVFSRQGGALLKVDTYPLEQMLAYRQTSRRSKEAGGVLLGRHILGSSDVVVDEVTLPMRGDKRSLFGFLRGRSRHQKRIDDRWLESRGTCLYLGEWHSHPESQPSASPVDLSDWRRRLREDQFDADSLFFVIIGIDGISAYEGRRPSGLMQQLSQLQGDRSDGDASSSEGCARSSAVEEAPE
jgi:integrative and conjugative element protein (TIGR02256 family)